MTVVAMLGLLPGLSLLNAQFRDEDEITTLLVAGKTVNGIRNLDPIGIMRPIGASEHPPGRHLLAVPFVWVFGANEFALRLPNVLVWAVAVGVAADIGLRLAGMWAGGVSGALLGLSGLFDLQGMGLGHGVATFWIMLLVRHMIQDAGWGLADARARRRYVVGAMYCAAGFFWFSSLLPICALYHALHGWAGLKRAPWRQGLWTYARLSAPFAAFYVLYYAIFLGVPAYIVHQGLHSVPFGQFRHNVSRWTFAHPNWTSLTHNLRALNWYFLPFVSWALLIAGIGFQARYFPLVFAMLLPYAGLFSFYIFRDTPQHFFAYFSWIVPFAVAAAFSALTPARRNWAIALFAVLTGAVATWTYTGHIRRYTAESYPAALVSAVWGETLWRNNVVRPVHAIAADLEASLQPDDRFIVLSDGALPLYYFPDNRYLNSPPIVSDRDPTTHRACLRLTRREDQCPTVRAAVSWTEQDFCSDQVETVLRYPGSDLKVMLLHRPGRPKRGGKGSE